MKKEKVGFKVLFKLKNVNKPGLISLHELKGIHLQQLDYSSPLCLDSLMVEGLKGQQSLFMGRLPSEHQDVFG